MLKFTSLKAGVLDMGLMNTATVLLVNTGRPFLVSSVANRAKFSFYKWLHFRSNKREKCE